jgi:uncharacterized membrane protein
MAEIMLMAVEEQAVSLHILRQEIQVLEIHMVVLVLEERHQLLLGLVLRILGLAEVAEVIIVVLLMVVAEQVVLERW